VWSADRDGGGVQRFSARTGKKVGQEINIALSAGVSDIAVGRDSVWVASEDVIVRLDVRTGMQIGAPVSVGEFADQIEVGNETVWVAGGNLHRIGVSSGLIVGRPLAFPGTDSSTVSMASDGNGVWVASEPESRVWRVLP